ncbi:ABC transporter permease [Kordiimonas aestuarii]|uniref:ABC transporter permease n=1 Tax=Kordiimonas aestuarii TaxID=1005925 RepID=UPI0021D0F301|nr:ABC transporter permease [Kordiimonas aestuarii]
MNRAIGTIYRKEMKDMLRDKRALIAIVSYVFGFPLMFAFLFYLMSDDRAPDVKSTIAIDGMAQAPGLVAYLERAGFAITGTESEPVPTSLPEGADALVVLPDDYAARLRDGKQARVWVYVDETSRTAAERGMKASEALLAYNQQIATVRLVARGVPTGLMAPMQISTGDVSKASFINKVMGNMMMLLFTLAPFVVGLSVALDALAGERERQSLASLMVLPVSSATITIGKWAMVASFGLIGTMATMTVNLIALSLLPADLLPFTLKVTPPGMMLALLQLVTLCMFVASLQLVVSIHAKSFKEGQTYMSMMMMVPAIVGYAKIYGESKLPAFVNYLPIFSDMESLGSIFFSGVVDIQLTAAAMTAGLLGTALCLSLTIKRLSSEHMLAEA